jgi:ribosomal protein S12 methylthiotransferase accessory factor YcaO
MKAIDPHHKDALPADTIKRIRALLDRVGFHRSAVRSSWMRPWHDCFSCNIHFRNCPIVWGNGKGLTRQLALASALAEFIERLQGFADRFFGQAGQIYQFAPIVPTRVRTVAEITRDAPGLLSAEPAFSAHPDAPLACVPFVDVFRRCLVDLPYNALLTTSGSSGLCAGNTPAEAICHGLCEVFERDAIRAVHTGELPGLPTLPINAIEIRDRRIRRLVRSIKEAGITIIVKDATRGGLLPVLAVGLINRRSRTCSVAFGSDPVAEIALSRCLTEAYQGIKRLAAPLPSHDAHPPLDVFNNCDILLDKLLDNSGQARACEAFVAPASNQELLTFLLARATALGRRVYVRDVSLLGFPSYYVFIEHLSDLSPFVVESVNTPAGMIEEVQKTILGLATASPEQVATTSLALFAQLTGVDPELEKDFVRLWLRAPILHWMGMRPLLAFMLIASGQYEKAQVVLSWRFPLRYEPGVVFPTPRLAAKFRALLGDFCDLRRRQVPDGVIADQLQAKYRGSRFGRGVRALMAGDFHGFITGEEARAGNTFGRLPIPHCMNLDQCAGCPQSGGCFLDGWRKVALNFRRVARGRAPDSLLNLLTPPRGPVIPLRSAACR